MQIKKRFLALIMVLSLICGMSVTVYAYEVPDVSKQGSISINMIYDQETVPGGEMTLYQVGEINEEDGNYSFVLTGEFTDCKASLDDIQSVQLAKDLAAYANDNGITGITGKINDNGQVCFTDLQLGLYLAVQSKAADGYSKADAFLVSIPMNENGTYLYDVDASPKVELEKLPDTPPTEPTKPSKPTKPSQPTLPQTGQLNWPIPVLAMLGLCLFTFGWMLKFGKKRSGHER